MPTLKGSSRPKLEKQAEIRSKTTKVYGPMTEKNQTKHDKKWNNAQKRNSARLRSAKQADEAKRASSQGMVISRRTG